MRIGCAVLAGGKSSRMRSFLPEADKALLEYKGKNFIKRLCDELDCFEEKVIARGNRGDMKDISWNIIPDIYPGRGPIGGLHAVLSVCESDAMFCVSCDMPLLQISLVKALCGYMKDDVDAVIAVTEEGRKHPLCGIYRKSVVPILEEQILADNNRMMAALNKMRVEYVNLDLKNSQQLKNINTPEDYLAILE